MIRKVIIGILAFLSMFSPVYAKSIAPGVNVRDALPQGLIDNSSMRLIEGIYVNAPVLILGVVVAVGAVAVVIRMLNLQKKAGENKREEK